MLREGLARYAAAAVHTPFVGDRADDLKPAFHAGRQRYGCVQGRKTLAARPGTRFKCGLTALRARPSFCVHPSQCFLHRNGKGGASSMALAINAVAQTIRGSRAIVARPSGTRDVAQPRSSVYQGASAQPLMAP